MKKLLVLVLSIIIVCFCMTGCRQFTIEKSPSYQPNTQWISDNEKIFIYTDETGNAYGYIQTPTETVPVFFGFTGFGPVRVYAYTTTDDGITNLGVCETWSVPYYTKNSFRATVDSTTFFEEGEKIVFRKLKDSEKIDYSLLPQNTD